MRCACAWLPSSTTEGARFAATAHLLCTIGLIQRHFVGQQVEANPTQAGVPATTAGVSGSGLSCFEDWSNTAASATLPDRDPILCAVRWCLPEDWSSSAASTTTLPNDSQISQIVLSRANSTRGTQTEPTTTVPV